MVSENNPEPKHPAGQRSGQDQGQAENPPNESGWRLFLLEWRGFFIFLAAMLIFRSILADWNHVPSGSMRPNILIGDRVVVNKLAFDLRVPFTFIRLAHLGDPVRGDIITFESPKDGKLLIKRVIGVPGDRVELRNNRLYLNQQAAGYQPLPQEAIDALELPDAADFQFLSETSEGHRRTLALLDRRPSPFSSFPPREIPPGHYFVMGDNRDRSGDSRVIGLVDRNLILGRAFAVAFSLDYDNYYLPRGGRFFQSLTAAAEASP